MGKLIKLENYQGKKTDLRNFDSKYWKLKMFLYLSLLFNVIFLIKILS